MLGVHVKRQIIEEGKRCATFYLCPCLELVRAALFCYFCLLYFCHNVGCVTPAEEVVFANLSFSLISDVSVSVFMRVWRPAWI